MSDRIEYTVGPEDEGMTLGQLARRRLGLSASLLRQIKWLPDGILLDGERVFVSIRPKKGQVMSLSQGREESSKGIIPRRGKLDIPYEDGLMLIIDKPGGVAVHPSPGHPDGTVANFVVGMFEERGQNMVFRAINRLDRGTSGLMCVAKSKHAAGVLENALHEGHITRRYLAVCQGAPCPPKGVIDLPIGLEEGRGIKRRVDFEGGQRAVTHYETLETHGGRSLIALQLETGRTHQIRVHMAHMGCPLVGDFMYGEEIEGFDRVALHSCYINIELEDRRVELESPLPRELERALKGEI